MVHIVFGSLPLPALLDDSRDPLYPISHYELIRAQITDVECHKFNSLLDTAGSQFSTNRYGFLVLHLNIEGTIQTVVPHSPIDMFLCLFHFTVSAGHPDVSHMYNSLRHHFYWHNMRKNVSRRVHNCRSFTKTR